MANKTALTIIVSVILTVILISLVNVGTSIILEGPEYEDYCSIGAEKAIMPVACNDLENEACKEAIDALDDYYSGCREEYNTAQRPYNQYRYYIFAGIGFVFLLVGLFSKENLIQLTGLAAGGILVFEGIVINLENKVIVFFSLFAILIIFGIVAWKVINKVK